LRAVFRVAPDHDIASARDSRFQVPGVVSVAVARAHIKCADLSSAPDPGCGRMKRGRVRVSRSNHARDIDRCARIVTERVALTRRSRCPRDECRRHTARLCRGRLGWPVDLFSSVDVAAAPRFSLARPGSRAWLPGSGMVESSASEAGTPPSTARVPSLFSNSVRRGGASAARGVHCSAPMALRDRGLTTVLVFVVSARRRTSR